MSSLSGARRCALLGHPVAHSLSPTLHGAAYEDLGIAERYSYGLQDVDVHQLGAVLDQLDESWAGFSLTMPLKQAVIPHLDLLAKTARVTQSVNTLIVVPGGCDLLGGQLDAGTLPEGRPGLLLGANTDVFGIVQALREALGERLPVRGVIVGARATASSALAAMHQMGVRRVDVIARSVAGAGSVMEVAERLEREVGHVTFDQHDEIRALLAGADVVVSTVPKGVADQLAPLVEGLDLGGRALLDAVYDPWPTAVAEAWQRAGGAIAQGWAMLLHQAWLQVRLMTGGMEPDVAVMRRALLAEMERRGAGGALPDYMKLFNL